MTEIEMPDGTILEFPDGMSRDQMRAAAQRYLGQASPAEPNADWRNAQPPEGMVTDPRAGQMTNREMMANAMRMRGVSNAESMITGGAAGATFGGADEVFGGLFSILPGDGNMSDRYAFGRERARAMQDASRAENPVAHGVSEAGGGATTALTYGMPAIASRGLLGAMAGGAGVGAVEGLTYGALSGEGGAANRAQNAGRMALFGAGAGAAAPAIMRGVTGAGRTASDVVSGGVDRALGRASTGRAGRALADTAERAGMNADQVDDALRAAAREGQPEFRVADALGQAGQRRLSGIARAGGDASDEIGTFLNQRQIDQPERMARFVEDAFDARRSAQDTTSVLRAGRSATASEAFDAAAREAAPVDVRGALSVIDERIGGMRGSNVSGDGIDGILSRFRKRLAADPPPSGESARELSDFRRVLGVKQDVSDAIGAATRQGRNNEARELIKLRNSLDEALEASSPAYRAANDQFRESSRVIDAVEAGQKMARPGARAVDNVSQFNRMTPDQQAATRTGYGDRALQRLEAQAGEGSNRARPFTSTKAVAEADAMATDPAMFRNRVTREQTMFETRNRALGGSRTADNLQDIADIEGFDAGMVANLAAGRWGAASQQAMAQITNLLSGMNPSTRALVAKSLMSDNADGLRKALQQAETASQRREVLTALTRIYAIQNNPRSAQ